MTFQTSRLNIRQLSVIDIGNIHKLHTLPETDEFNTLGIPETIQTTEKIVNEWLMEQNTRPQTSYVF